MPRLTPEHRERAVAMVLMRVTHAIIQRIFNCSRAAVINLMPRYR